MPHSFRDLSYPNQGWNSCPLQWELKSPNHWTARGVLVSVLVAVSCESSHRQGPSPLCLIRYRNPAVKTNAGTSLAVQWSGLGTLVQGMRVQSLAGEVRSHMPHIAAKNNNNN